MSGDDTRLFIAAGLLMSISAVCFGLMAILRVLAP